MMDSRSSNNSPISMVTIILRQLPECLSKINQNYKSSIRPALCKTKTGELTLESLQENDSCERRALKARKYWSGAQILARYVRFCLDLDRVSSFAHLSEALRGKKLTIFSRTCLEGSAFVFGRDQLLRRRRKIGENYAQLEIKKRRKPKSKIECRRESREFGITRRLLSSQKAWTR